MKKPIYQLMLIYVGWIVGGIIALGAFLGAIVNALTVITPLATYGGTIAIFVLLSILQIYLKYRPLGWVGKNRELLRIRKLKLGIILPAFGFIILLWIPRFQDVLSVPRTPTSTPTPQITQSKDDVPQALSNVPKESTLPSSTPTPQIMESNNDMSQALSNVPKESTLPSSTPTSPSTQPDESSAHAILMGQESTDYAVSGCARGDLPLGRAGTMDNHIRIQGVNNLDSLTKVDILILSDSHHWQDPCNYPVWQIVVERSSQKQLDLFFEPAHASNELVTFTILLKFSDGASKQFEVSGLSGRCCY